MPEKKTYVIDTNVLLYDPHFFKSFKDNEVVITATVLEELDNFKKNPSVLGKNARTVIRFLDSLRSIKEGNLHVGVKMEDGPIIRIALDNSIGATEGLSLAVNDNKVILVAFALQQEGEDVVFVSRDIGARIKAEAIGLKGQDYKNLNYNYQTVYTGVKNIDISKHDIDTFYKDGALPFQNDDYNPNKFFLMKCPENTSAIGKYNPESSQIEKLITTNHLWGIRPRNMEQRCAVDLLLRDDIKLVTLMGPAGTGKTLLAVAAALNKVFDDPVYNRVLISRPIVPLGRDIGYLPGTKSEKLFHWMQPIYDNLEFLCDSSGDSNETFKWVMESKKIEMEAVTFIRGRTLPKMFMIIDEAQNLTPHEVKTIISRAGVGTKVVLTGDPTQIDNPYLDRDSNALTYLVGKMQKHKIYGHIFLEKTERSELAALAVDCL